MSVHPQGIFIWRGRIHLGDEPGIYGDATYAGLAITYPLTIRNIDSQHPVADVLHLEVFTENVKVFPGYPGHNIVVSLYHADLLDPAKWNSSMIKTAQITGHAKNTIIDIPIPAHAGDTFISVGILIETSVMPGLYDDFLCTGLDYTTAQGSIYVKFGFE